jgi:hypothetical protein
MATSAAVLFDFPYSAGSTTVTAQINQPVSSVSHFLSTLQSFLVSTLGWTLIDTGVSGLAENFVVRSSGTSGDRLICLKFGASAVGQVTSGLSCFACVSFASATDVASNATTDVSLTMNGTSGTATRDVHIWLVGNLDHVMIGTGVAQAALSASTLYAGLVDELVSSVTQTPNQVVIGSMHAFDGTVAVARMVETPTATFNVVLALRTYLGTNVLNIALGGVPDLNTGLVHLYPVLALNNGADRVYGFLKNVMQTGDPVSAGMLLCGTSATYAAFGAINTVGTARASILVRVG